MFLKLIYPLWQTRSDLCRHVEPSFRTGILSVFSEMPESCRYHEEILSRSNKYYYLKAISPSLYFTLTLCGRCSTKNNVNTPTALLGVGCRKGTEDKKQTSVVINQPAEGASPNTVEAMNEFEINHGTTHYLLRQAYISDFERVMAGGFYSI